MLPPADTFVLRLTRSPPEAVCVFLLALASCMAKCSLNSIEDVFLACADRNETRLGICSTELIFIVCLHKIFYYLTLKKNGCNTFFSRKILKCGPYK